MKTKSHYTLMFIMVSIAISTSILLSEFTFKEGSHADNAPLKIKTVFDSSSNREFVFEDEDYIDDIPFIVEMVFDSSLNHEFIFEDEDYIDDIPFNTNYIVTKINRELCEEFCMLEISENRRGKSTILHDPENLTTKRILS